MNLVNPSEECMERAYKEFGTTKAQLKEDVQVVKKWIQQQPHLPNVEDDKMLEIMLIRCKGSVERAKQTWDLHFTLKGALPELFAGRDPLAPEFRAALRQHCHQAAMPQLTSDGYRLFISKLQDTDTKQINAETLIAGGSMIEDVRLMSDRAIGSIEIFDCKHFTLDYALKWTPPVLKKMDAIAKCYRVRLGAVHILSAPPFCQFLYNVAKSVMSSKIMARVHVHADLESLHKHVDRDLLPQDYGGQEKPLAELSDIFSSEIERHRDWFLQQNVVGKADESKRPVKSISAGELFGFEGSFKKLTVD